MSSWAASLESPLERIDRDLKSLQNGPSFSTEPSITATPTPSSYGQDNISSISRDTQAYSQQDLQQQQRYSSSQKGKGKQPQNTLLQNVLSKKLKANTHDTSPLKLKLKPKTPKRNPYVPPELESRPKDWDGIVDLSKPITPKRHTRTGNGADDGFSSDESEDDRFLHGMSPPITMDFARPSAKGTSAIAARIGRTPVKEAAARIGKDLIGDAERHQRALFPKPGAGAFGGLGLFAGLAQTSHSTQQSISSPSLSRYTKKALGMQSKSTSIDTSLESLLRQVAPGNGSNAKGSFAEKYSTAPAPPVPLSSHEPSLPDAYDNYAPARNEVQDDSFDSLDADDSYVAPQQQRRLASPPSSNSSDSFGDSPNNSAGQVQVVVGEDSFSSNQSGDSSFSDSFDADDNATGMPIHPLARGGAVVDDGLDDSFDDSFDDYAGAGVVEDGAGAEPTETVFGVRGRESDGRGAPLRFHGEEVFDTGDGLTAHLERDGDVPITPTPMYGR
jgi:DASH complex subunit ASK1